MNIKLKICGMNYNLAEVAALHPDYIGFIFYDKSPRNFKDQAINFIEKSKKVGVFVNAPISFVLKKIKAYKLDVIQLHGDETVFYINQINQSVMNLPIGQKPINGIAIWKVFSIDNDFDFNTLTAYENVVDTFLFDTKGKNKGGNGFAFNWAILKNYPSTKPFVLSGGIGLDNMVEMKEMLASNLPIYGIDVNSKFEIEPGLKDISALKNLIKELT